MNTYTVSFFGHRSISQPFLVEERVEEIVRKLIGQKEYVQFLVCREGNFDQIVSSVIRRTTKNFGWSNFKLILVLPFVTAEYRNNQQKFQNYYDEVEICPESRIVNFSSAFQTRNRSMIDRSDLIVCGIDHHSGGAYRSVQYAEQINKKIWNVME